MSRIIIVVSMIFSMILAGSVTELLHAKKSKTAKSSVKSKSKSKKRKKKKLTPEQKLDQDQYNEWLRFMMSSPSNADIKKFKMRQFKKRNSIEKKKRDDEIKKKIEENQIKNL